MLTFAAWRADYRARGAESGEFEQVARQVRMFGGDDAKMRAYFKNDEAKIAEFLEAKAVYEEFEKSTEYLSAVNSAEREAERIKQLAAVRQIPPAGALALLRDDPKTQGLQRPFAKYWQACHDYFFICAATIRCASFAGGCKCPRSPRAKTLPRSQKSSERTRDVCCGSPPVRPIYTTSDRAIGLAASLDPQKIGMLITENLMQPDDPKNDDPTRCLREASEAPYFGNTSHREGEMADFVQNNEAFAKLRAAGKSAAVAAALSEQARLPYQTELDNEGRSKGTIVEGAGLIKSTCTECHNFGKTTDPAGNGYPDLDGYASREWLISFISNPSHERFYADGNDRMPGFAKGKDAKSHILTPRQIELLVDLAPPPTISSRPKRNPIELAC